MSETGPLNSTLPPPPDNVPPGLAATVRYISDTFGLINANVIDAHGRIDRVRDRMGMNHAQYQEAIVDLRTRLEPLEKLPARIENLIDMFEKLRPDIEARLIHAASVAKNVRAEFGEVSARYQQSINELHDEQDEHFASIDARLREQSEAIARDVANAIKPIESALAERKKEEAHVKIKQLDVRQAIAVALITTIGGGIVGGFFTLAALALRGGLPAP